MGGAASAAGLGLFDYNRKNYMMDQKLHYSRYLAGNNFAIAQMNQYRADIADLTLLTTNRMEVFHSFCHFMLHMLTAVYCPGRLGLHTPPPPGWMMGLEFANIGNCYIFLGLTVWFAMHASLRANSAATHMLTRFVRLPVPSQKMLDRARTFLASYEDQPFSEVLRIPFMRHQRKNLSKDGGFNENTDIEPAAENRTRHGFDVPAWYRKEKSIDPNSIFESMMPYQAMGTAPEHFEAYREIQMEWWPYDVYARICTTLSFLFLTSSWCFQQIGHHFAESRTCFTPGGTILPVFLLQQIVLTLDILPNPGTVPVHRIGPLGLFFAWFALGIEYQPWYNQSVANLGYAFVYCAYLCQIIFSLSMLWLCAPDLSKPPKPAEAPASSWWPVSWALPSMWCHAVWIVAPPRVLEPGQHDLVGEMRNASRGNETLRGTGWPGLTIDPQAEKKRDVHNQLGRQGESPAWWNVKWGLIAVTFTWVFLVAGFSVEVATQGTTHPALLNALGLPNNLRDPRYRPAKPWAVEPPEVGTGGLSDGPAKDLPPEGVERRLSSSSKAEIADRLRDLLPHLNSLASGKSMAKPLRTMATISPLQPQQPARVAMRWPAMFEPRLLACGHRAAAAAGQHALSLSHSGRGIIITTQATLVGAKEIPADAVAFSLEGASGLGHLVAATWDEQGLLIALSSGITMECPGSGPVAGRWKCNRIAGELPIGPVAFHGTVALSRAGASFRAAVSFPDESTVTVFSSAPSSVWQPAGEVRTHAPATSSAFSADATELLLASADGAVARMNMLDGSLASSASAVQVKGDHSWLATCSLALGGTARLALAQADEFGAPAPVLFMG